MQYEYGICGEVTEPISKYRNLTEWLPDWLKLTQCGSLQNLVRATDASHEIIIYKISL